MKFESCPSRRIQGQATGTGSERDTCQDDSISHGGSTPVEMHFVEGSIPRTALVTRKADSLKIRIIAAAASGFRNSATLRGDELHVDQLYCGKWRLENVSMGRTSLTAVLSKALLGSE